MRKFIFFLIFFLCILCFATAHAESVKLKMIIANPSDSETKILPVKTYLPKGIVPEDIVDKGNFKIDYDFEKSLYYAYQDVTLKPQETVTLELEMRDIWNISNDDISSLKEYTQKILDALKSSQYYSQAKILSDSIMERLNKITESQNLAAKDTEQRISDYEANNGILKEVKKDIGVLEDLVTEVNGASGIPSGGPKGESHSVSEQAKAENQEADLQKLGTIKFRIEVSNSSDDEKSLPVKYYLPSELRREHIVDSGGLDIAYDYQKGIFYVYKDAVELLPKAKKEFTVTVKDVWVIPAQTIQALKEHTQKLMSILAESQYKTQAKSLGEKIIASLKSILDNQNTSNVSVERHIGDYRSNLVKFDEARRDVAKLEKTVIQAGGSVGYIVAANPSQGALRGTAGLEMIGKSMFRGKAPDATTSWKIIWIIIGFLAIVSFLFFILWWLQIKTSENRKKEQVNQRSENTDQKTEDRKI